MRQDVIRGNVMGRGVVRPRGMRRDVMRRDVMRRGAMKQGALKRRNVMNGWTITGALIGAVVAIGLALNGKDLIRYLRITSM